MARQFDRMRAKKFDGGLKGRATDQPELGDTKDERKRRLDMRSLSDVVQGSWSQEEGR